MFFLYFSFSMRLIFEGEDVLEGFVKECIVCFSYEEEKIEIGILV